MTPSLLANLPVGDIARRLRIDLADPPEQVTVPLCTCRNRAGLTVDMDLARRGWEVGAKQALVERHDYRTGAVYALVAVGKVLAAAGRLPGPIPRHRQFEEA